MLARTLGAFALVASLVACESLAPAPEPSDRALPPPLPGRAEKVETTRSGNSITARLRDFEAVQVTQKTPVWCWAACTEMIFKFDGDDTTQDEIAERIHGYETDGATKIAAASRYEIYRALSPDAPDSGFEVAWEVARVALEGAAEDAVEAKDASATKQPSANVAWREDQAAQIALDRASPPTGVPIDELLQGNPAIVGLRDVPDDPMGHVYVVVGATYRKRTSASSIRGALLLGRLLNVVDLGGLVGDELVDRFASDKYAVEEVELVDPWLEGDAMRVTLSIEDFAERADFVTTRASAHEILTRWSKVAVLEVE